MFENPKRGRQARKFTTNVPKILDLKSSSEQIFSENWRCMPLIEVVRVAAFVRSGGEILSVTFLNTAITVEKLVCKVNLYSGLKRFITTIINNNMHSIIQSTNNNKEQNNN